MTIGPVAVTASMFPRLARQALAAPEDPRASAVLLVVLIVPGREQVVETLDEGAPAGQSRAPEAVARRLGMWAGTFNLIWAVVVVLMIVRPGSSTGVGV